MTRTFEELQTLETFDERFEYLRLRGTVGEVTFGFERRLNQLFYTSREWQSARTEVIIRDSACDLGVPDYEISSKIIIHHMNPMTVDDIISHNPDIMNPRFLICTSNFTHLAIHYGDKSLLPKLPIDRQPGDTSLWRKS